MESWITIWVPGLEAAFVTAVWRAAPPPETFTVDTTATEKGTTVSASVKGLSGPPPDMDPGESLYFFEWDPPLRPLIGR